MVDGLIRQQRYEAAIAFLAKYQKSQTLTPRYHKLAGDAPAFMSEVARRCAPPPDEPAAP